MFLADLDAAWTSGITFPAVNACLAVTVDLQRAHQGE